MTFPDQVLERTSCQILQAVTCVDPKIYLATIAFPVSLPKVQNSFSNNFQSRFRKKQNTLKVQILAGTNFCRNLFLRELIFAISIFKHLTRTYFREFRDFLTFRVLQKMYLRCFPSYYDS